MMKNTIYLTLLLFALSGCIEPYEAKTDNIDSILVVEGFITDGTTQITLSKSVDIKDDIYRYSMWYGNEDSLYVNHASVYLECENGSKSEVAQSSGKGIYLIETGELNVNTKYRLAIHVDDEIYHSGYLTPAISPPVELSYRVNYQYFVNEKNENDSVINNTDVLLTTKGYEHQPGYYLWSYRENWKTHALLGPGICWSEDSSRVLLLGTTERLSENTIRGHRLMTVYSMENRVSQRYRIQVKQNAIHQDAYDYFENQKRNSEQTGSIFGVIPSELTGNIKCTSNPAIPVIGYVDVSTTSVNELYLTRKDCFDSQNEYRQILRCFDEKGEIKPQCYVCFGTAEKPKDWKDE